MNGEAGNSLTAARPQTSPAILPAADQGYSSRGQRLKELSALEVFDESCHPENEQDENKQAPQSQAPPHAAKSLHHDVSSDQWLA